VIAFMLLFAAARTIHDVDFCSLRYDFDRQVVRLHDGTAKVPHHDQDDIQIDAHLIDVQYGDVTFDGRDEALVVLGYSLGGTGFFTFANLYGIEAGELRILGRINGGDRAYGNFHDIAIEHGRLRVVRNWTTSCMGCVEGYETTIWKWNGTKLALEKKTRVKVAEKDIQPDRLATNPCAHP
jgi:hypothetical protein